MDHRRPSQPEIIVTLTSLPRRVMGLPFVLRSLLKQRYDDFSVELYLATEKIPLVLRWMQWRYSRLSVVTVSEDLGPATKFVYALQRHPEAILVVCDDDHIYAPQWLPNLLMWHERLGQDACVGYTGMVDAQRAVPKAVLRLRGRRDGFAPDGREMFKKIDGEVGLDEPVEALWPQGHSGYVIPNGRRQDLGIREHLDACVSSLPAEVLEASNCAIPDDVVMGSYLYRVGVRCLVVPGSCHRQILTRHIDSHSSKENRVAATVGVRPSMALYLALVDKGWYPVPSTGVPSNQ